MANAAMATGDFPVMASSQYASSTYDGSQLFAGSTSSPNWGAQVGGSGHISAQHEQVMRMALEKTGRRSRNRGTPFTEEEIEEEEAGAMANQSKRRLVQVFIADPNENVPLEQSLLYRGDQKLTDANDQELFFELDIKDILTKHNEARVKIVDKKVKERTEYLEPAKIRDLKMVVVTVAEF